VLEALCDDLNTPLALSEMHKLADAAMAGDGQAAASLKAAGVVLGLLQQTPDEWFRGAGDDTAEIDALIAERLAARAAKNFARADAIRSELTARGIVVEDGPKGSIWRRAT
jgi:cysteinyl-tRNA synthetase